MNLTKLFETQKALDERIISEKRLEGRDMLSEKILALQVELGELANEWRGFKFWSKDMKPRTKALKKPTMNDEDKEYENPLLVEYVDCLHFILSIGLETKDTTMTTPYDETWIIKTSSVTEQFSLVFSEVSDFARYKTVSDYASVLDTFLGLGEMLGFTWDQIEQAYYDKNEINHTRQNNGY